MNARTVQIVRSLSIIGGTGALIAGVTFAALTTNTVTLADNTLNVSNNVLRIYDSTNGYTTSAAGFTANLVPGIEGDKQPFYLKNTSGVNLGLSVHAGNGLQYVGFTDFSKVQVNFYAGTNSTPVLTTTLSALLQGDVPFTNPDGQLNAGAEGNGGVANANGNYSVTFKVDPAGVQTGASTINVTHLDLTFTGTSL